MNISRNQVIGALTLSFIAVSVFNAALARTDRFKTLAEKVQAFRSSTSSEKSESFASAKTTTELEDWNDASRNRVIPVKLYLPGASFTGPRPVFIFSHGLGGSRDAAAYLGDYLAQKGYVCVHVQHPGSDTPSIKNAIIAGRGNGKGGFKDVMNGAASGENLIFRLGDIKYVLDELERRNITDSVLKGRLDLNKVALGGHSFGAGTTLGISGITYPLKAVTKSLADSRIKAAVYLSPPVNLHGRSPSDVYGQIKIPGLLMTGTNDNSPIGKTPAEDRRKPFDGISAPHQYLINYKNGDHAIFGGSSHRRARPGDEEFHQSINKVVGAFLDAYLLNDKSAKTWLDGDGAKTFIEQNAMFERK